MIMHFLVWAASGHSIFISLLQKNQDTQKEWTKNSIAWKKEEDFVINDKIQAMQQRSRVPLMWQDWLTLRYLDILICRQWSTLIKESYDDSWKNIFFLL